MHISGMNGLNFNLNGKAVILRASKTGKKANRYSEYLIIIANIIVSFASLFQILLYAKGIFLLYDFRIVFGNC